MATLVLIVNLAFLYLFFNHRIEIDWSMVSAIGTLLASFVAVGSLLSIRKERKHSLEKEIYFNIELRLEKLLSMFQDFRHVINGLEANIEDNSFSTKEELEDFYNNSVVPKLNNLKTVVRSLSFLYFDEFNDDFEMYICNIYDYIALYKRFAKIKHKLIIVFISSGHNENEAKTDELPDIVSQLHQMYEKQKQFEITLQNKLLNFVFEKKNKLVKY